jgi:mRNA interferase RelE/StbE
MTYSLSWTEASKSDYASLDGSQRVFVDKGLDRIRVRGMQAGARLNGDLAECNKLKNNKLGLRIIFRQIDQKIEVIEIVVIGKRSDLQVYKEAQKRLRDKR